VYVVILKFWTNSY